MKLYVATLLLVMRPDLCLCQVLSEGSSRPANLGVVPQVPPPPIAGAGYGFAFPADKMFVPMGKPPEEKYESQYPPDDNSFVQGSVTGGENLKAAGSYEIVFPDTRSRIKVTYVADDNGYRAKFVLRKT